jgi:hypothetical protein
MTIKNFYIYFPVLILMVFCLETSYPAETKASSSVEGRIVCREGNPQAKVKVFAVLPTGQYKKGYNFLWAETDSEGKFLINGLYPGLYYRIMVNGGQCNDQKERIRSMPTGETLKLGNDFVLIYSPFDVSPDGVIRDPRTGLEWAPVPAITFDYEGAAAYVNFLNLAGEGWRLPTLDELKDLFESGQKGCGLDWAFENRHPKVWSADPKSRLKKWLVTFSRYRLETELWDDRVGPCDNCRVLPVRSPK